LFSGVVLILGWPRLDPVQVNMLQESDCEVRRQLRILRSLMKGEVATERTSEDAACLQSDERYKEAEEALAENVRWYAIVGGSGAAIPPAVLFILGWAGLWVARGFTGHRLE
jgi:hypothetical protein